MKKPVFLIFLAGTLILGLGLLMTISPNISSAQDDPTVTPESSEDEHEHTDEEEDHTHDETEDDHDATSDVAPEVLEIGYEVYLANGCVECHGENAEGTDIGPALAGHTREDIYRQLRAPTGVMLPFTPEQIGIRDAEFLVAYIENLPMNEEMDMGDGHNHGTHGEFRLSHVVVVHHWYALSALQEGNTGEAIHHISHIIEFTEGPHQIAMQSILEQIIDGELTEAQVGIENMVFGLLPPESSQAEDYIRIGLVMIQLEKPFHAVHYLEHSGEMLPLDSPLQDSLEETIVLIEFEDIESAETQLNELIAGFSPDDDADDDHADDADDDHADDDHADDDHADDDHADDDHADDDHADDDHADDDHADDDHADDDHADDDHTDDDHADDDHADDDHADDDHADDDHADDDHADLTTIDELVLAFESVGATVELAETLDQPFFSVQAQVVLLNENQALQVYEYADEISAMVDVELVAPSGSSIGTSQVSWMMPPHFYHTGHLVVIYIGADADTLTLLTEVLGEQFAGQ